MAFALTRAINQRALVQAGATRGGTKGGTKVRSLSPARPRAPGS
jgi:hypothetical protein